MRPLILLLLLAAASTPLSAQSGKLAAGRAQASRPAPSTEPTILVPSAPPFAAKPAAATAGGQLPKLKQLSAKTNQITDEEAWYNTNGIAPVFLKVPNPNLGDTGDLPASVPPRIGELLAVRAFQDEGHSYVVYGENYAAGTLLAVWRGDFSQTLAHFDFSAWRRAPKVLAGDEDFVDQAVRFARIVDGVLYVSHSHSTYAKSSGGMNAYLSALEVTTGALLWRSQPLVSNAANFLVIGDAIVSGYGFTDESDFLYVLDRHSGRTASKIPVKSGPEVLALHRGTLHVRTYNTDYRFQVE